MTHGPYKADSRWHWGIAGSYRNNNEVRNIFTHIKTVSTWDEKLWQDAGPLYMDAFGGKGAKPVEIIRNMFAQEIAELHVAYSGTTAVAMALTGKLEKERVMIIDYLAVSEKERNHGLGKQFVDSLRRTASDEGYQRLIIEAESEETAENKRRIRFWQSCGFLLTEYVHHYIWVPEPYQAMYFSLSTESKMAAGEELFKLIDLFHRLSFSKAGKEG